MAMHYFTLADLRALADRAIDTGAEFLRAKTLPSPWSEHGEGWQELLVGALDGERRPAGFYASCDGQLLLRRSSRWDEYRDFAQQVHVNTLVPVFRNTPREPAAESMQCEVPRNTMKLARFLQASALWRGGPADDVATQVARGLRGSARNGAWRATVQSKHTSLAATVEATLALVAWGRKPSKLTRWSTSYLQSVAVSNDGNNVARQKAIVAAWALTQLPSMLEARVAKRLATDLLDGGHGGDLEGDMYREDFVVDERTNDFYTYDVSVLRAQALIRLRQREALAAPDVRFVLPLVFRIAHAVNKHGMYSPDNTLEGFRFWQHHQALELLSCFQEAAKQPGTFEDGGFMIIKPKLFQPQLFKVEPKLAAIIMPFKEKWSDKVYAQLKLTLENAGYRVWRSDEERRDDIVVNTIWEKINIARLIVADCTGNNANVFYELGIAHTLGKTVFMCAQATDTPFNVRSIRHCQYKRHPAGLKALDTELRGFLRRMREPKGAGRS